MKRRPSNSGISDFTMSAVPSGELSSIINMWTSIRPKIALIMFSMFSFAAALGREGFALLIALFALRLLFVLPGTFLTAGAAMDKARLLFALSLGRGKRAAPVLYGADYWYRFAVTCVCLLIGSALELWLTPLLLTRFT